MFRPLRTPEPDVADALRRQLPELADALHSQLCALSVSPGANYAETLAANLASARLHVLRYANELRKEGCDDAR